MPSVTAFVADMTTISERPKAMGLVSVAISGGFIIGPGVGGFIAYLGIRAPFLRPHFSVYWFYFDINCFEGARETNFSRC